MPQDFERYLFPAIFLGLMVWLIFRAKRAEKNQQERLKKLREAGDKHFQEAMEISRQNLQVSKDLLEEIRALRKSLEKKD